MSASASISSYPHTRETLVDGVCGCPSFWGLPDPDPPPPLLLSSEPPSASSCTPTLRPYDTDISSSSISADLCALRIRRFGPDMAPVMNKTTLPGLGMLIKHENEMQMTSTENYQTLNHIQPQIYSYPQQPPSTYSPSVSPSALVTGLLPAIFNHTQFVGYDNIAPTSPSPTSGTPLSVEEQRAAARKARFKMLKERSKAKKVKLRLEAQARAQAEAQAWAQAQGRGLAYIHPSRILNMVERPVPVKTKKSGRRKFVKETRTKRMTGPQRMGNMNVWTTFRSASVSSSAAHPLPHQSTPSKPRSNPNLIPLPPKPGSLRAPDPSSHPTTQSPTTPAPVPPPHQIPTRAPPGPPRETCFFYYHVGVCRRGAECERAHEVHFTWPIPPPPGYVHRQACRLLLCPLKEGMEEVLKKAKGAETQGRDKEVEIERAAEDEVLEFGLKLEEEEKEEVYVGVGVDGDVDMDVDVDVEIDKIAVGVEGSGVGVELSDLEYDGFMDFEPSPSPYTSSPSASPYASPSPPSSRVATPPPSLVFSNPESSSSTLGHKEAATSDGEDDTHLTSISHAGTYHTPSKRRVRRNSKASRAPSSLPKQIPLSSPGVPTDSLPAGSTKSSGNLPAIPPAPTSAQTPTAPKVLLEAKAPCKPKALAKLETIVDRKVCFFWYHQGFCKPRDRTRCSYIHTLGTSVQEVSCPDLREWHPGCNLPLCPIRLARLSEKGYFPEKTIEDAEMVRLGYELPVGEGRAEWDTDFLRQAFGEI
ncbi:hypothetical protein BCR34DRAFT_607303 [Clohesyomyces aquaticus]|uniref:C3H1-type domain-containing protein n=1 Tax=Clohesyomyces aquaticus TaxID=1231657 RepID=A0A1Y1YH34_9PLEO|nr:hypothetical protein BCR34DRAFT_607303 [Clohesyomyces aquaticus]